MKTVKKQLVRFLPLINSVSRQLKILGLLTYLTSVNKARATMLCKGKDTIAVLFPHSFLSHFTITKKPH